MHFEMNFIPVSMKRALIATAVTAELTWLAAFLPLAPSAHAAEPISWWKGNLHTHTLWSDGDEWDRVLITRMPLPAKGLQCAAATLFPPFFFWPRGGECGLICGL